MSAFFGVFSPGCNIDQLAFGQLESAIHREGYDELETYVDDHIAMGHLMLRVTSESAYDKQPLKSECGRYVLVGHFRLDYRDELGDRLGLTQKELEYTPDSLLVMKSYQKWGNNCVNHLEGDWAFVIFDVFNSSLFFAKDIIGFSALFYTVQNGSVYFSSSSSLILAISSLAKKVNWVEFINLSNLNDGIREGNTLLEGFFSLKSSTSVVIDKELLVKEIIRSKIYPKSKIRFIFLDDYTFELRSVFAQAIKSRINGVSNIGLSMSSGRDSTSVFYYANKILESNNSFIHTYTWDSYRSDLIDSEKRIRVDETIRVKKMLSTFNHVSSTFLDCQNDYYSSLFSDEKRSNILNPLVNVNALWITEMFKQAKLNGNRLLLAAPMGNFSLTWNGPMIQNTYLKKLDFISLIHSLNIQKSNIVGYLIALVKKFLVKMKSKILSLYNKRKLRDKRLIVFSSSPPQNVLFKSKKTKTPNFNFHNDYFVRKYIVDNSLYSVGINWYLDSQQNGCVVADPTADIRLMKYCFSIPEYLFNFHGEERYIYKKLMKGRLPDYIVESNKIYPQAYNAGEKLMQDVKLSGLLNEIIIDESISSFVDFSVIKQSHIDAKHEPATVKNVKMVDKFLKQLSLIEFLRKNPNFIE